jgi:hypothetical protein
MRSLVEEVGGASPPKPVRGRVRRFASRALVGVLAFGLIISGVGLSDDSAKAASYGPSYDGPNGHIG